MIYRISRIEDPTALDANWQSGVWKKIAPLELRNYMGIRPKHFPVVQAKLAYSDDAIYGIFQVNDRYVRAVAKHHHAPVSRDSCVELFFTPAAHVSMGYFNLEINCGGVTLFHFQRGRGMMPVRVSRDDMGRMNVFHTMPTIVDPEIEQATTWAVAFRLPLRVVQEYFPTAIAPAAPGVVWRGNMYKCADETSHPHWMSWAPVTSERPDFHRPDCFGTLEFQ
jgi:hypothetical protein